MKQTTYLATLPNKVRKLGKSHRIVAMASYGAARTCFPAREDQATDRSYRIGQTRDVFVYYPVVVAENFVTLDEKLDQLLDSKRKLS